MFCKSCQYDLRGLTNPCCPECGRTFDFLDASTFDSAIPGRLGLSYQWMVGRRLRIVVGLGIGVLAVCWFSGDDLPMRSRRIGPSVVSAVNLRLILTTWAIQQNDDHAPTGFDRKRARQDIRPSYSAISEYSMGRVKAHWVEWSRTGFVFLHLVPLAIWLVAIAAFWRGSVRRIGLVGLILIIVILGDAGLGNALLNAALPGRFKFLDDYVYLSGTDFMSLTPQRKPTIAAYERVPSGARRIVGFADGHAESMWDDKFLPLLAAQGLALEPGVLPAKQP